jgi:hypothetical protein
LLKFTATAIVGKQLGEITCHQRVTAVVAGGISLQQMADLLVVLSDGNWPSKLAPQATAGDVYMELLVRATGKVSQSAVGVSARPFGIGGVSMAPTQAAAVVKKITGLAGRAFRGRVFVPFIPDSFLTTGGELSAGVSAAYATFVALLFGPQTFTVGGSSTTVAPVLVHQPSVAYPLPLADQDVTAFVGTGKIGTQRRRGDYGQANNP